MRWVEGGWMEPTSILEAATLGRSVLVVCKCGNVGRFQAHCLWWHFKQRRWDDRFSAAGARFWCRRCRSRWRKIVRPEKVEPVRRMEGDFELGPPDEREWKEACRRLR
jgi:hypothetical protein